MKCTSRDGRAAFSLLCALAATGAQIPCDTSVLPCLRTQAAAVLAGFDAVLASAGISTAPSMRSRQSAAKWFRGQGLAAEMMPSNGGRSYATSTAAKRLDFRFKHQTLEPASVFADDTEVLDLTSPTRDHRLGNVSASRIGTPVLGQASNVIAVSQSTFPHRRLPPSCQKTLVVFHRSSQLGQEPELRCGRHRSCRAGSSPSVQVLPAQF